MILPWDWKAGGGGLERGVGVAEGGRVGWGWRMLSVDHHLGLVAFGGPQAQFENHRSHEKHTKKHRIYETKIQGRGPALRAVKMQVLLVSDSCKGTCGLHLRLPRCWGSLRWLGRGFWGNAT